MRAYLNFSSVEMMIDWCCRPKARAHMRAQAAVSLLHLACVPAFREFVGQHFVLLAITMQVRSP